MRQRGRLIAALELLKDLEATVTLHQVMAFLYVADHHSLAIYELVRLSGFSQSMASRSLRSLGLQGTAWALPPAIGLVEAFLDPDDGRSHVVRLTAKGRGLRDRLDALLGGESNAHGAAADTSPSAPARRGSEIGRSLGPHAN